MTIDTANIVFSPIYTIGHYIGMTIVDLIKILSGVTLPNIIVDTIGLLVMMTMILVLSNKTKKIAWGIVTICWALVIMRIGMLTMGN
jgi:hypothetical protein